MLPKPRLAARNLTAGFKLRAAVNCQFLERLLEDLRIEVDAGEDVVLRLRARSERVEEQLQRLRLGIVALVEELVGAPVDERVHQHGA